MHPRQPRSSGQGHHVARWATREARPIRTGASFGWVWARIAIKVVFYPIGAADPHPNLADINWIAEITVKNDGAGRTGTGTRK